MPSHPSAPTIPSSSPLFGIGLLVLSSWSLSGLDTSGKWILTTGLPLIFLCWVRFFVHLVLVLALIRPRSLRALLRTQRPYAQVLRGTVMFVSTFTFFSALQHLPQAEATSINFLAPLILLACAPWILGEPARLSRWIAALSGFLGVLIIIRPGSGLDPVGVAFGLCTAMLFAVQYLCTRRVAIDNPMTTLVWSGGVGAICLTLALPVSLPAAWPTLREFGLLEWLVLLTTGVWGALGHILQIQAYRMAPASMLAPFIYLQIVAAAVLGWLVWGDFPDALTWVGIAVICISGIAIGALEWRRAPAPAVAAAPSRRP
ncbi:DMT family transporter [Castellaniella sp. S9]|uniref:DMT family transporter n=1 Tax=Castellaniella sp. S9 TaxID=2993652 RepID=UPI0022B4B12F|nr:DMT family transporter [Castellaniella sp. S9]